MLKRVEPSIAQGRRELTWLVAFQLAITLAGVAAGLVGGEKVWPRLVRLAVSIAFAVAAMRGARWASIITGGLSAIASVELLLFSFVAFDHLSYLAVAGVVGSMLLAVMAVYLLFSPHIRAFQAHGPKLRAEQAAARTAAQRREWDERYGVRK